MAVHCLPGNRRFMKILSIDIGGSKIKVLMSGETEPRKAPSGRGFTPRLMIEAVKTLAEGWDYEAVSLGYPGLVGESGPRAEPGNLGGGWVGFDFAAAFERPVKVVNDAAMQALGSYCGGRMLFLGLGTGLGSALVSENVVVTLELGHLTLGRSKPLGEILGRAGRKRLGSERWQAAVFDAIPILMNAVSADYVALGGGNAKKLSVLPHGARLGHNQTAFLGGFRLWGMGPGAAATQVPHEHHTEIPLPSHQGEWRML